MSCKRQKLALGLALMLWLAAGCQLPGPQQPDVPPREGASLSLFVQPGAGEAPVLDALNAAKESIRLKAYVLANRRVIDALKSAARRGVSARMIIGMNPYGSTVDPHIVEDLSESGVELKGDSAVFNHTHEKTMVIDDEVALIMTGNMTASSFSANREYGIITRDPKDVAEVAAVFEADWERVGIDLTGSRLIWAPDNARERIVAIIDGAQSTLDIEQQNMQDPEIVQHIESATGRGVQVRILSSPRYPIEEDTDEPGRDQLRQAGAHVRYLDDPYIHAKIFVIDGQRGFVGSQNLTTNSLDFNREAGILFDAYEPVAQLAAQFESDWAGATEDPFATAEQPLPEEEVIPHQDASEHYGQKLSVELTVAHIYNSGRVLWLMPDDREDENFKVVIFPSDWPNFPEMPDVLYDGETIRVSGLIVEYRGWPEIIVAGPEQIVVVGPG